jgi:Bacterial archaeo-eukaryotic release factor family 2
VNLGFLRPLYNDLGSYASVYLDTDRASENAAREIDLRWRAAREQLTGAGATPETLEVIEEAVSDPDEASPGRAVFARDGRVMFTGALDVAPRRQIARLANLPHVMPLLAQRRPPIPHLRVSASRAGGEIVAIGGNDDAWRDWVTGRQWPIHKTPVGGWSQDKHQHAVEDTWAENAKTLAAEVVAMANQAGAGHIVVGGDVRARTLLLEHLPRLLRQSAVTLDDEVAADSQIMAEAADRALAGWADQAVRERFDDWRTRKAHGLGTEGLAATMAALRDGQVSDLFVADDPSSVAAAWLGPAGAEIAASEDELTERGVEAPLRDRADSALLRAATTTEAELHFLPPDLVQTGDPAACGGFASPLDGVCAVLRFSESG